MKRSKIGLKEAERFHGHLGPYLVLGLLAGELALKRLRCRKHFGLEVKVWGATRKPKSCLIDGLQLSAGATYGKGNIQKIAGSKIRALFCNLKNKKEIKISLREYLIERLDSLKGHKDSEAFARELYKTDPFKIFNLITGE